MRAGWMLIAIAAVFAPVILAQQLPKAPAVMNISVTTGSAQRALEDLVWDDKTRSWVARDLYAAHYEMNATSKSASIRPRMKYLSLLTAGGPIAPISYMREPFQWGFPILVLQVANNGDAPLVLTSAVFMIQKSVLDPTPVPVIKPDQFRSNARNFSLSNEGWGELGQAEADFNLLPLQSKESPDQYNPPFVHTVKIGSVLEATNVDVSAAFTKEGVQFSMLPTSGRFEPITDDSPAFGKFKGGGARLVGRLRFNAATVDGRTESRAVKFAVEVWLYNEYRVGVPPPPSYDYEAKFQVTGSNYVETVPIKKTVDADKRETISIRLGVAKSSVHDFHVSLRSANATVDSPPIRLEMFIPRSGAKYIQGR